MVAIKKKGLGRGLEALLGEKNQTPKSSTDINRLPLTALQAGKYQPRQKMEAGALQELAESIREQGVMQPLLVRLVGQGKYEIIAPANAVTRLTTKHKTATSHYAIIFNHAGENNVPTKFAPFNNSGDDPQLEIS